ncbi:alpha/beta hydrolase [uncultured Vibrio sp.]|uniref:alpha/beta fold hydrolase n=1 Tax=uncultured Vibrio sp. TaxID=114054 RepID=UPI0025E6F695|nr:alpha/beta hydrolase [uncultured Vibrio sp.]
MRKDSVLIECGEIATLELGSRETAHTTVLFLHGWLDNAASFSSILPTLSSLDENLHLCAIDLPGHGHSFHKGDSSFYPFHDYIDDLHQLLMVLSPNRLVIVGHSLGALIASCYSAAFPEHVTGLVQIEGFGPLAEAADKSVDRLRSGVLSRQRIRRKPARSLDGLEQMTQRRAQINNLEAELIRPIVERGMRQQEETWQWQHDSHLQSDSLYRMSYEHAKAVTERIQCPQLVILGDNGYSHLKHPPHTVHNRCEVVTIRGGHHCHLQDPQAVTELIFGALNKI